MKLLVINGPNLNMLGVREKHIYGNADYSTLLGLIEKTCRERGIEAEVFQSNHEGAIVDKIQQAYQCVDGIIINPAAYTHTSIAIPDALKAVAIPAVEVHLSDISQREEFRRISYVRPACVHSIMGQGLDGYLQAIVFMQEYLAGKKA